jgi:hypothetical protein
MNRQPNTQGIREQDARLVQIVDAALADATRRAGPHLACRPGCTPCCHGAFAINPLDAQRLRSAMAEMALTDPGRAETIAARARLYLEGFASSFPGDLETGILGDAEADQEAFEAFANEAACPALHPESGLSVCELCFTQAAREEIAAAEMQVPHAEEQALLSQFSTGETIVAFCLIP